VGEQILELVLLLIQIVAGATTTMFDIDFEQDKLYMQNHQTMEVLQVLEI
jgi:nitrate reductase gamma subunit